MPRQEKPHPEPPSRTVPDEPGDPEHERPGSASRPQVADPPQQRTTFGAPTVGGAVAAAAMAGPARAEEPDVSDENTVAPGDGAVPDETSQEPTKG